MLGMCSTINASYNLNRYIGFVPPYALKEILAALAINTPEAQLTAFKWALAAFVANLSFAQVDLFQGWHTRRCYERTRGQLFCSLHYKSLKRRDIGAKANGEGEKQENADLGKIVNLMQYVLLGVSCESLTRVGRGDAYAVAQRFWNLSAFLTAPIRLVITLIFLYRYGQLCSDSLF